MQRPIAFYAGCDYQQSTYWPKYEGRVKGDGRNWWGLIIFLRAVETQGAQEPLKRLSHNYKSPFGSRLLFCIYLQGK